MMGTEDYNLLKSTLEEVATLRENKRKNRRDLKGLKKNLADLEQELPILRDNLEGVTSREGKMPSNNEIENELIHIREGEKTAKEEADRLYARRSIAEKRIKDSEGFVRNESIVLFLVLAACSFMLIMVMGANPLFECENGESLHYLFVDDGEEDCLDGSDERPTEANAERASFIIGCLGFLAILISIIVFAFDWELKSRTEKDVRVINSQLKKQKEASRTRRIQTSKLEEQLRTRRSLKNDKKELPILIEECLKDIEYTEMDIQRTAEEIRNISEIIKSKMTSISHLIPYSEFVPE